MNWKIRLQSGKFWMGIIGLVGLIALYITNANGIKFDWEPLKLILETVLTLLVGIGVVTDPTTPGIGDSAVVMAKTSINQTAKEIITGRL